MDTIRTVPVIKESQYVVIGGGLRETAAALTLAHKGNRVLMIVRETCLCSDLCGAERYAFPASGEHWNPVLEEMFPAGVRRTKANRDDILILHPDRLKRSLEQLCEDCGIDLLYNTGYIDSGGYEGRILVRTGGKSGIQGILCDRLLKPVLRTDDDWDSYCIHVTGCPEFISSEPCIPFECGKALLWPGAFSDSHGLLQITLKRGHEQSGSSYIDQCRRKSLETLCRIRERKDFSRITPGYFALRGFRSDLSPLDRVNDGIKAAEGLLFSKRQESVTEHRDHGSTLPEEWEITAWNSTVDGRGYKTAEPPLFPVAIHDNCDFLAAGGGTAGAMAGIHAGMGGARTVILDMNEDIGGTATVGGVSTYWFGRRYRDVQAVDCEMEKLYDKYGIPRKPGLFGAQDEYHPGIRSMALQKHCREHDVTVVPSALIIGAIKEKAAGRVLGAAALLEDGVHAFIAGITADATGDGDLAVFAGAAAVYGSDRDSITYWASLAQYTEPGQYRNNFSSCVNVGDAEDYTRFIRIGRKRGDGLFDHGSYVAPRETRHIKGEYRITLKDAVSFREYEDGIYTCFSNYDPKGKLGADMIYGGVLPPQIPVQIPLRALVPVNDQEKSIPSLLVLGKAISCTHDAFPGIRMQPDLMHQGAVIGALCAWAIREGTEPADLNAEERKSFITKYTGDPLTMEREKISAAEAAREVGADSRTQWVDMEFTEEVREEAASIAVMTADPAEVLPILKERYRGTEDKGERLCLAGYMLWHGSDMGTGELLRDLEETLSREAELPQRTGSLVCVQLLPDHGVMPELVYRLNLLAWSNDPQCVRPFAQVLYRLKKYPRDYQDNRKGIYHYIESFAYVAERSGRIEMAPMLLELADLPELKASLGSGREAELLTERFRILLLSLYRALAALGRTEGYCGLVSLMLQSSLPAAESAYGELRRLLNCDLGLDAAAWRIHIDKQKGSFRIQCRKDKIW